MHPFTGFFALAVLAASPRTNLIVRSAVRWTIADAGDVRKDIQVILTTADEDHTAFAFFTYKKSFIAVKDFPPKLSVWHKLRLDALPEISILHKLPPGELLADFRCSTCGLYRTESGLPFDAHFPNINIVNAIFRPNGGHLMLIAGRPLFRR